MADHYIRDGGSGDGSDWTNAWDDLPATLVRGDTYFVADGTYAAYTIDDAVSGTTWIYVKKATAAAHGTETGWASGYGDGVATFTDFNISTSYVEFDGAVGSGKTGHGFELTKAVSLGTQVMAIADTASFWKVKHVHAHFPDRDTFACLIYGNASVGTHPSNVEISYCYLNEVWGCHLLYRYWDDVLFEHNYLQRNYYTALWHGEPISGWGGNRHVYRYNIVEDGWGTGGFVNLDDTANQFEYYGNLFFTTASGRIDGAFYSHGCICSNDTGGSSPVTNAKVYNNTAYNIAGARASFGGFLDGGSGNVAYNNLYINCDAIHYAGCTNDYDGFSGLTEGQAHEQLGLTPAIFTSAAASDFTLASNTDAGTALGASYDEDMLGNARATWSRGAYEYAGVPPVTHYWIGGG